MYSREGEIVCKFPEKQYGEKIEIVVFGAYGDAPLVNFQKGKVAIGWPLQIIVLIDTVFFFSLIALWSVSPLIFLFAYRDTTIAAANLVNATIIMIFLYLRKVYLYSKLTRQARDQDMKAHLQPTTYSHSIYGSSQKTFSTLAPVLYGNCFP